MNEIFKNSFGILAGLASIVGVGLIFVRSDYAIAVVCGFYCIAITVLAVAIYRAVLKSLVFRNSGKYRRLASFCTFVCDDGKTARFEVVRLIQAKVPFLDKIEHKYKWRGKNIPKVFVNDAVVPVGARQTGSSDSYDTIVIKLDRVLTFNECSSVRVAFESSLSDSKPRICYKVEEPTDMLRFKVLLGYVNEKLEPAVLVRQKISSEVNPEEEIVQNVDFDLAHRSYSYVLDKPEIGYYYILTWNV